MSSQDFSPGIYPYYAREAADVQNIGNGILPAQVKPRERYWLYGLLFVLTLLTTSIVGTALQYDFDRNIPFQIEHTLDAYVRVWRHPINLVQGLPFSLTLITILLAHEMGHFLASVCYRVDASLPYFLPAPTLIGTFGAFIRIRAPIYFKRVLFDIGIAGPVAGFIFLLPALAIGLAFSKIIPGIGHQTDVHFGIPLLEWLLRKAIFPGAGANDIYLHPVGRAAWFGMFATAFNLFPIGQLDGGHVLYALAEQRHKLVSNLAVLALVPLGYFWRVWLVWALVLFFFGRRHPVVYDESDLGRGRRQLGWVALVLFILCFTFAPLGT
ncbi:MAG: site-2 protease family protein [Acidobacteriia bacterium]|nr:site-2 protease family protein [Terriglobia bacterium]